MNDVYILQSDGQRLGPFQPFDVARAIATGSVAPDALVAMAGGAQWQKANLVPEIASAVETIRRTSAPPPSVQPVPSGVAPAPTAAAPVLETAPAPKPDAPKEKAEEQKAPPPPWWLPLGVFGAFAFVALLEVVVAAVAVKPAVVEGAPASSAVTAKSAHK